MENEFVSTKKSQQRENFARYFVIVAVLLTGGIDLTQFIFGGGFQRMEILVAESFIDIAFIIATYFSLRSVIHSRAEAQRKRAKALEELSTVNKELLQANQFKTRLMNMAAHDLRNPIGVVMGFSEILMEERTFSPTHMQLIKGIHKKSNEMVALINDLLDVSVAQQNAISLRKQNVVLDDLIEDAIRDIEQQTAQKSQPVFFDSEGPLMVSADGARLKQVLVNLLSNASKYSPPQAPIHVELRTSGNHALISVSDGGPGLTAEEIRDIFKVFSPVKKTPTAGEPSTGLGLSIAKSLVEQHGGRLEARSEGPGRGSRFTVDLPL